MAAQVEEAKLVSVGGTDFLVDGFAFQRGDVKHYVLTHFHSDHTVGLTRSFDAGTVYCTEVTAALIIELTGVDKERVRAAPLGQPLEVGGARLTFLDAHHCPGSALVAFEPLGGDQACEVTLHTGDCRASEAMRRGLVAWLAGRRVARLFLDTTYCGERWRFPPQAVACQWLSELTRKELQREPRTLFVVGAYQIGKERAVEAVAEAADSPVFVEPRRWRVVQLAGWGEARLPSGKPLWGIDREDCSVWLNPLGGLGHEALKHFLDSAKGKFEAVVAFRPTGWSWAPRAMARGSDGCRVWAENDGRTRVYGVPYSEHSSFTELRELAEAMRPRRLTPTVNSETRAGRERMMRPFLGVVDLQGDRERMDHYLQGTQAKDGGEDLQEFVDALALSGGGSSSSACRPGRGSTTAAAEIAPRASRWEPTPCRCGLAQSHRRQWAAGMLRGPPRKAPAEVVDSSDTEREGAVDLEGRVPASAGSGAAASSSAAAPAGVDPSESVAEELRSVDVQQQRRLLAFFEAQRRPKQEPPRTPPKPGGRGGGGRRPGRFGRARGGSAAAPPPGGPAARGLLARLGATAQAGPAAEGRPPAKRRRREAASAARPKRRAAAAPKGGADPKLPGERRPTRFVPQPSLRVRERIDRAFSHRLYFLRREPLDDGRGARLHVLGSTGNVYHADLGPKGSSCTCLDFAKGGGVCKHLLFVALRVLKLDRDDPRVWQTSLVPSELEPILARLARDAGAGAGGDVAADAPVLRGYQQACGEGLAAARRPLPADCPICLEEMQAEAPDAGAAGAREAEVEFCGTCGQNVHADCRRRWAAASPSGDACPLCRSPWGKAAAVDPAGGPINLAAYSSEHRGVSLATLYPETHGWIRRRDSEH